MSKPMTILSFSSCGRAGCPIAAPEVDGSTVAARQAFMRWIRRGDLYVLQARVNLGSEWQDVPLVVDPPQAQGKTLAQVFTEEDKKA